MSAALFVCSLAMMPGSVPSAAEEVDLEVVVTSDPFARFDNTRWRVDYQLVMPYPVVLYAASNRELNAVALDSRMVMACELGSRLGRRVQEVACVIESAALSAAPWYRKNPYGQQVLEETSALLSGMQITLQVTADGRVTNVGLVGEPQGIRRVNVLYENLRQLVKRAVVGFHLKSSGRYTIGEEWAERNSEIFSLPAFRRSSLSLNIPQSVTEADGSQRTLASAVQLLDVENGQTASTPQRIPTTGFLQNLSHRSDAVQAPASYGWSVIAHRMDRYQGRYLVQSTGTGVVDLGIERHMTFRGSAAGVSVFDGEGMMTERRWTVSMEPTASSLLADGVAGWPYMYLGSVQMLGADEASEVGGSYLLSPPNSKARGNLPLWPAL